MEMSANSLLSADLTRLSDVVLERIQAAVMEERHKRRREASAANQQEVLFENGLAARYKPLPNPHHQYNHHWLKYLNELLAQDWSHLFPGTSDPKYYVYMHYAPNSKAIRYVGEHAVIKTSGLPFYIGKGCGDRAFDMKRNQGHGATLRELLGRYTPTDIVSIVKDGLTEQKALELESKLIYFFGTKYEKGRRGILVNLDIPLRPMGI